MSRSPAPIALGLLIASLLTGCNNASPGPEAGSFKAPSTTATRNPGTLKVALLPDESPATIIRKNEKLRTYLESALKRKVELVVTTDYSSMIEAMRRGNIDVGYFGPLSYVLLRNKMPGAVAFAAKLEGTSPTYTSVLVAGTEAGIADVKGVRGKTVAFGDPASTASHLIPKHLLLEGGLKAGEDYKEVFAGAHDAAAIAVQNGNAQAGGLSRYLFDSLITQGTLKAGRVKVIAESKPYPNYPWVLTDDLDPKLQAEIKAAFYDLKDRDVLRPLKADGFAPMKDSDYDEIRTMAKILGVDAGKTK